MALLHKVSPLLLESESNRPSFVPKVVSIGPYHHGDDRLAAMEPLKKLASDRYCTEARKRVHDMAESVRNMYEIDPYLKLDPDKFKDMLFHDACFLVHFIICHQNFPHPSTASAVASDHQGSTTTDQAASSEYLVDLPIQTGQPTSSEECLVDLHLQGFVVRDLFLLENQLPYKVLKAVVSDPSSFDKKVEEFIRSVSRNNDDRANDPVTNTKAVSKDTTKGAPDEQRIDMCDTQNLLDMLHQKLVKPKACDGQRSRYGWDSLKFRSVKELTEAGIKFKPNKIGNLTDVKYKEEYLCGILSLPRMIIDDTTKSKLLNLMALEMCPKGARGYGITSYVCLLDNLIDHADDVRELRLRGVLVNCLGNDQQVADLFNELANDRTPDPEAYVDIITKIHDHLDNWCKVTIATTYNTHFNTPWSKVATIAATLGLALSAVQAWYSVPSAK
ncbi:hypothetical protein QJS10_CPB17g01788 [Acorus calamus]|uniref:Uncharacterized protein n=1 Tax=Acorus calamus TaxID=4465 RepID=A0AAV9CSK0_ACOCL|nr:hypothetical protein QJS10_CPB17g01788 [Acorus calamus]